MPRKYQFETEYKANFKPYKVELNKQPQFSPAPREPDVRLQDDENSNRKDAPPPKRSKMKNRRENVNRDGKENRALEYKAGLAPSMARTKKQNFMSEYQKQFHWKKALQREAPILSAEKIVFKSQDNLPPTKPGKISMPTKSEYQLQFVQYPIISPRLDKDDHKGIRKTAKQQMAAGLATGKYSPEKQSSPLPMAPEVPHRAMVFQSEYHANFQPPALYEYVKGAWVGADPPHLYPPKGSDDVHPVSPSWFQQVTELRKQVRSYRARARSGSQFMGILKSLDEQQSITLERANRKTAKGGTSGMDVKEQNEDAKSQENQAPRKTMEDLSKRTEEKEITRAEFIKQNRNDDLLLQIPDQRGAIRRHSIESLSNLSTKGSSVDREDIDSTSVPRKREAWAEPGPIYPKVVPPYGVSSNSPSGKSSAGSDSMMSDVTLTDELMGDAESKEARPKRVDNKTRKLYTGQHKDHETQYQRDFYNRFESRRLPAQPEEPSHNRADDRTKGRERASTPESELSDETPPRGPYPEEASPQRIDNRTKKLYTGRHHEAKQNRASTPSESVDSPRGPVAWEEAPQRRVDDRTKKLFTGKHHEAKQNRASTPSESVDSPRGPVAAWEEGAPQRRVDDRTKKLYTGGRQLGNVESSSSSSADLHPSHVDSKTRKLHTGRGPGRMPSSASATTSDSYSSGDEASSTLSSCSVLSVEAMDRRRELASKTLQRARNRKVRF